MKKVIYAINPLWIILSLLLVGCKDMNPKEAKNGIDPKNKTTVIIEEGDNHASIGLEDGKTIQLKAASQTGHLYDDSQFTVSLTDFETVVLLELKTETPIKKENYQGDGVDITVKKVGESSPLNEEYSSFFFHDRNGNEGNASINLQVIGENHSEGTFSGTLYSKSGKEATIKGEFKTN